MACDCCGSNGWSPRFADQGFTLGQCPECDLLSIDKLPDLTVRMTEMEEGHFASGQAINKASKQIAGEQLLKSRYREYVKLVRDHVPTGRWLDVGCGAGTLLAVAKEGGFSIEGIELSRDRRVLAERSIGAVIHDRPLELVGFAPASFDVISLINVFSHLVSPADTFDGIFRALKPGGVVLMATGEMGPGIKKSDMRNWHLGDHLHFLGERTMDAYAAKHDFSVVHRDRRWLPEALLTREWLRAQGKSPVKNAIKRAVDFMPGGLRILRAVQLRRHADSQAYSSLFLLAHGSTSAA